MLHQNNEGMQKPGTGALGDCEELASLAQDPHKGLRVETWDLLVLWSDVLTSTDAGEAFRRENHRRPTRQHAGQRNERRLGALRIALGGVEGDRTVEAEIAGARPPQRGQMSADAQLLAEVVRQRPDVEA